MNESLNLRQIYLINLTLRVNYLASISWFMALVNYFWFFVRYVTTCTNFSNNHIQLNYLMSRIILSISIFALTLTASWAQTNKKDMPDSYEINAIVRSGDTLKLERFINEYNYDINQYNPDDYNMPLLFIACSCGDSIMVDFLLKKGADPSIPTKYGFAANWAAEKGKMTQLQQCINAGFDPKKEEMTYWVEQYKKGDETIPGWMSKIVSYILANDTIVYMDYPYYQFTDPSDNLILSAAVYFSEGNKGFLKQLIKAGVNVNLIDKKGATALHCAIAKLNPETVKFLVKNGASANGVLYNPFSKRTNKICNNNVNSLLLLLRFIEEEPDLLTQKLDEILSIIKILKKAGADANLKSTKENQSAIDVAALLNVPKLVKCLEK